MTMEDKILGIFYKLMLKAANQLQADMAYAATIKMCIE